MGTGWRAVMGELVAQLKVDFTCNDAVDGRVTLVIWRLGQVATGRDGAVWFLQRRVAQVLNAVWTNGLMGAQLPPQVPAGPGLRLPHGGRGIILHPDAEIGAGCTIYHQVTLGIHHEEHPGRVVGGRRRVAPVLGDGAYIGAGAVLLGPLEVAPGTTVGANAVLLTDTEPGTTYVGVPAVACRTREAPPTGWAAQRYLVDRRAARRRLGARRPEMTIGDAVGQGT